MFPAGLNTAILYIRASWAPWVKELRDNRRPEESSSLMATVSAGDSGAGAKPLRTAKKLGFSWSGGIAVGLRSSPAGHIAGWNGKGKAPGMGRRPRGRRCCCCLDYGISNSLKCTWQRRVEH